MDFIKFAGVNYMYQGEDETPFPALKGIDLTIKKGEYLTIIGPNGSGKSTLAKLFNGLLLPTEGQVLVNGMNTSDEKFLWEIRQKVGLVFQNPDNQLVATIVEEDVAFGPENLGLEPTVIRKRVDEALDLVDMAEYRNFAPHNLSGGQKQRVAIAGIIAMRPDCIVFDEPTAMLDPLGRREVLDTIRMLNEEGMTVIYITHFMEEVMGSDRVIILQEGKIIGEGAPADIFKDTELIKEADLEIPEVLYLVYRLQKAGLPLSSQIFTEKELVDALCSLS